MKPGKGTYTPPIFVPNRIQGHIDKAIEECAGCSAVKILLVQVVHADLILHVKSSIDLRGFDAAIFYERKSVQNWEELQNPPIYQAFVFPATPPEALRRQIVACFPENSELIFVDT